MKFQKSITLGIALTFFLITAAHSENPTENHPDFSKWSEYAESIANCSSGTFQLPDVAMLAMVQMATNLGGTPPPSPPPLIYQIIGWESGKCRLKITTYSMPENPSTTQQTSISTNCAIPSADLITLSNSAKKIATGTFESSTDSPTAKILKNNCAY